MVQNSNEKKPWAREGDLATDTASPQDELRGILYKMEQDPTLMGISSLAKDGVLRSWTADRDVVDAVALRPALIKAYLDTFPYDPEMESTFKGVDGRTAPQEQWFNPPKELRPAPLAEEHRERDEAALERNRKLYYERREGMGAGQAQSCPMEVKSDHKID